MHAVSLDNLAIALAKNRASGTVSGLAFAGIVSKLEAAEVQLAALDAYNGDRKGYALAGTNAACQRILGLHEPVIGPIAARDIFDGHSHIHLPQGVIGAQCELTFTIGNSFPLKGDEISRPAIAETIVACRPTIGLVGRRAFGAPHNDVIAIADFGLHVATICGPAMRVDWDGLDRVEMTARINGETVVTARGSAVLGHPLEAVALLARELALQGKQINAGEIVTTGSWSPILQVLPGQTLSVDFETIGKVSCTFA
ncbi:2-keto-4-pentenoate hydratase [Devosia lacusdianchii]|uniref:2-keto-4-pentenoate hydratase n=1 Tax=Devosia lacusdianchii TaxID=2917991 RepID=UPI001F052A33|nr:fumarylacetoacetate hydrolase family protein [Devosia sp. JXJ CY 41]